MSANPPKRALVIGAGSSGITALAQLLAAGIDAVAYEARGAVGGAWNFDKDPGACLVSFKESGRCVVRAPAEGDGNRKALSPMYSSLRTNVPTSLVAYREHPSPYDSSYLDTAALEVLPKIHLTKMVTLLRWTTPTDGGAQREWLCEVAGSDQPEQFDIVLAANGHFTEPLIPLIAGLGTWKGEISHSRWYRSPEQYKDKTVLVVGNYASGYDITRQIAEQLHNDPESHHRLYQSRKAPNSLGVQFDAPDAPEWAKKIELCRPIERVEGSTIWFEGGQRIDGVDLIMFATGYLYSFPFASPAHAPFSTHPFTVSPTPVGPTTPSGGFRVHNLDSRQLFYLPSPTLAFLALPLNVIPFPVAEAQGRLLAAYYSNTLPQPLEFKAGAPEDEIEAKNPHVWLGEREMNETDQLLRGAGDGGEGGTWGRAEKSERELRIGCMGLRKAVLGY